MKRTKLNEVFTVKEENSRCNCENEACEELKDHKAGSCTRPTGEIKALYIGSLCDKCANRIPQDFLLPPHGTAKE